MVSLIRYEGRPGKSKFDALAPLFSGRSDPEGWRLLPSWQLGGAVLTGVTKGVSISVVPLFHMPFPKQSGQQEGFAVACGILWRNLPLALAF